MNIPVTQLPSGGYGLEFPSISISPMTFIGVTKYLEGVPEKDPLEKYLYDIQNLIEEDQRIGDCYLMDIDFLIFYKKLITISNDLEYDISITCPDCGHVIKKRISFERDIKFKQIDRQVMEGAKIELNGHSYETIVPTVKDFFKVFEKYLKYRRITDLKLIKTIALIKDFDIQGSQIEADVLGAKHEDITLLLMLQDIYYDHLLPLDVYCPECNKGKKLEERGSMAVSVDSLTADFFREICRYCPIDGSKILFKQIRES